MTVMNQILIGFLVVMCIIQGFDTFPSNGTSLPKPSESDLISSLNNLLSKLQTQQSTVQNLSKNLGEKIKQELLSINSELVLDKLQKKIENITTEADASLLTAFKCLIFEHEDIQTLKTLSENKTEQCTQEIDSQRKNFDKMVKDAVSKNQKTADKIQEEMSKCQNDSNCLKSINDVATEEVNQLENEMPSIVSESEKASNEIVKNLSDCVLSTNQTITVLDNKIVDSFQNCLNLS